MKNRTFYYLLLLCCIIGLHACDKNDSIKTTVYTLSLTAPEGLNDVQLSDLSVSLKNTNTNRTITSTDFSDNKVTLTLAEGLYTLSVEGKIQYTLDQKVTEGTVKSYKESVYITGETNQITLPLFLHDAKANFVIEEVFFVGNITPEGEVYDGDQYIKIYNNSDNILYADGLVILESAFLTSTKYEYDPDIMSTHFAVTAVYKIPGSGNEHPVNPGESILICDIGKNHSQTNPNSFDLSNADFEWFDEGTNDVDTPVPNMEKIYCSSKTIWTMHKQGLKAYAIGRLGVDKETFLQDYKYDYNYTMVLPSGTYPMSNSAYKIPNEWIIDAVNVSNVSQYVWNVTAPNLDMGWTYCAEIKNDNDRYGKSIKRKTLSTTSDGRKILKDTNNSTNDFEAKATPTLKKN